MAEYINFHSDSETDIASFKNRTNNLYNYRNNIKQLINRNGFKVTTDFDKFLKLKAIDSESQDIIYPNNNVNSPLDNSIDSEEAKIIKRAMEDQAAVEFVQLFLDKYMAPIGSDIEYRLGKVTGIKSYCYNDEHYVEVDDPITYGQYDSWGRIDTTLNLRYSVPISGVSGTGVDVIYEKGKRITANYTGKYKYSAWQNKWIFVTNYIIPPTSENYVNFFFPPYVTDAFADDTSLAHIADHFVKSRTWDSVNKKWVYNDEDISKVTYDTGKLLSMRTNPTLRAPAFKAINDNITMLQYFMEQTIGIVSTYLTEWDISLYIQEGLLSDKHGLAPSYLTLTNRITKDNPSRFRDSNAFNYGVLNAAVSKTPLGVPTPNTSIWNPSAFPLSTYWIQYDSVNRGDGLDKFYDVALAGFPKYKFKNSYSFKDKIEWGDQLGAAYSGWYNWDNMEYWKALYTNSGDGFEHVDIVHMGEEPDEDLFENKYESDGTQVDGVIQRIIDALYEANSELEPPTKVGEEWCEEEEYMNNNGHLISIKTWQKYKEESPHDHVYIRKEYYDKTDDVLTKVEKAEYDDNGNLSYKEDNDANSGSTSVDEESDYRICKIRIKGSRILKLFLKRDKTTSKVLKVANKESGGDYSSASSTTTNNSSVNSVNSSNGSSAGYYSNVNEGNGSGSGSGASAKNDAVSMIDSSENENGQYSRTSGVSQLSPALYGGPHGKFYSPKTVEGYFEADNEFFRNIPRMDPNSNSSTPSSNFKGLEHNYSPTYAYKKYAPYRSPSSCLRNFREGYCDYTYQVVQSLIKHYIYSSTPYGYYNGWYYHAIWQGWEPVYYETGFTTPDSEICTDGQYHDRYGTNIVEWENYYKYYSGTYTFSKDYWGKMWTYKRQSITYYTNSYGQRVSTPPSSSNGYGRSWTSSYYNSSNYGYWDVYLLRGVYYRRRYYCEYQSWDNYYYKRALMHSNPNASNDSYWQITQGCYGATLYAQVSPRPWWYNFFNWFMSRHFIRYTPSANTYRISIATSNDQNRWRLTFPRSGIYFKNPSIYGGVYEVRTNEEQNFMKYVTGNVKESDNPLDWHDVMLFQSTNNSFYNRYFNGPELIFKVPVRKQQYDFAYYVTVWYCRKVWYLYWRAFRITIRIFWWRFTITIWLPWIGFKWVWYPRQEVRIGKAAWIEVDMNRVQDVWSGLQKAPWSNLSTTRNNSVKQEIYNDVPPANQGRSDLPDTPTGYLGLTSNLPSWAIPINTDGVKPYLYGWGYCTSLPGIDFTRSEQTQFEDCMDYLNLQRYYNRISNNSTSAKHVAYKDMKFPFYTLNNNLPLIYIKTPTNSESLRVAGTKRYAEIKQGLDWGLRKTLVRMYTTSTLFKYNEEDVEDFMYPRIVSNDCAIRTLTKIATHQYSWLNAAKSVFVNNVSFDEVLTIMNTTVNKSILSRSLPSSKNYNTQSIYYRYWIDKANTIFHGSKASVISAFDRRIDALKSFINKSSSLIGKTMSEWTYEETVNAYNYINELKQHTVLYKNTITNKKDDTIEEYMFAYLNVLYEYRKFYINQRCNKVNGTLWQMRQLEGAIPEVITKLDEFTPKGKSSDPSPSLSNQSKHQYKVAYYDVTNSNYDKSKTAIDEKSKPLGIDKTMVIYIKVNYAKEKDVADFLTKCKEGKVTPTDQRYIYIPENGKYAELPFDDMYRYISREWSDNEAIKIYNRKASKDKQKKVNSQIDESIFTIQWADKGKMDRLINASEAEKTKIRNNFGTRNKYPYVYKKPDGWESRKVIKENPSLLPMIKFDIIGGINPGKVTELWNSNNYQKSKDVISAKDILCTAADKSDYWCVAIPISSRPRTIGYQTNLLIKSYRGEAGILKGGDSDEPSTTPAGLFGYMLYPITEEQANSIPGIGVGMSGIQAEIKNAYLANIDLAIASAQDE